MRNSGLKIIALVAALIGSLASPAQVAAQRNVELISFTGTPWRYLANGSDQGTAWQARTFNDSAWPSGAGLLGWEPGNPGFYAYPFNTSFTPYDANIITYYFRAHFTMQASNFVPFMTLLATNYADDGSVVYLNGTEVARFRISAGPLFTTPASGGPAAEGQYEIAPTLPSGGNIATNSLLVGDNVIAVEVHQTGAGSSDIVHGMSLFLSVPSATAISFTSQPQSVTVNVGANFTLSATTSGASVLYQWQTNNSSGVFVNVPGANSSTYVGGPLTVPTTITYRLVASNSISTAISSNAVVTVVPDTFGPRILSATVLNEALKTNLIELVFNENLLVESVHLSRNPSVLTNDTFRVVMFGSNITVGISNTTYAPSSALLGTPPKVTIRMNTTNWINQSNYYIILNNVRDSSSNVIAPNSIIPVSWQFSTNIFTPISQAWTWYNNYQNDYLDFDMYTNAWQQPSYTESSAWSSPIGGVLVHNEASGNPTDCFQGFPVTGFSGAYTPTLLRTWFMWPTNSGTNADLIFKYFADDAASIFLNGEFLFRDVNFPIDPNITSATRANGSGGIACRTVTNKNLTLRRGSNLLAVAVAQQEPISDITWAMQLDASSSLPPGPLPAMSVANRLTLTRPTTNTTRITWATNAYGWALVYTTNIVRVGTSNIFQGPWIQEQPNMANTLANPFTITNRPPGPRRFYELMRTQ